MSLQFHNSLNCIPKTSARRTLWRLLFFGAVLLLPWFPVSLSLAVVYVDGDRPGGDGSSWETAYRTIEDGITGGGEGQGFSIAEGTYTPSEPLMPKRGSQFYGGFAGNETARHQRNVSAHPTTIDGQDSLIHVVNINSLATNVRIDGFTIKRGNATSGSGFDKYGGGFL